MTFDIWCDLTVKNEPANLKISRLDPNGVEDPCEIYISMEHRAGCVVYDVHPILRIFGTAMIFVGLMLYFFSIQLNQLFLDAIIQTAVFVLLISIFRQMHYFAFFDPTEPYNF